MIKITFEMVKWIGLKTGISKIYKYNIWGSVGDT
jgi:hypothetical protein